jgi:hypothetical protein
MMAWVVVPCLDDLRDQLNEICPDRDKTSDGSIGDTSHAAGKSSHNPDKTGSPEYADGDAKDEVRARDFDKDLRSDITAEQVVQHLVKLCRSGHIWWLRYIIFKSRIWRANGGWATETYTGKNTHDHHFHVNSQFNQASDNLQTADYRLEELVAGLNADDVKKVQEASRAAVQDYFNDAYHGVLQDDTYKKADATTQANWRNAATVLRTIVSKATGEGMIGIVGTDDGKGNRLMRQRDTVWSNQDQLFKQVLDVVKTGMTAMSVQDQEQFARMLQEFSEVPAEVMAAVQGGTDQQIADALDTMLGDRKAAVVALLSQHQ